eukprot:3933055-Rhodomonas_salina.2
MSDRYTGRASTAPAKRALRTAAKTGSAALTTCTKLTEPRLNESTVTKYPKPCSSEIFWSAAMLEGDGLGTERMPTAHCGSSQIQAARSWAAATVAYKGKTLSTCLLAML